MICMRWLCFFALLLAAANSRGSLANEQNGNQLQDLLSLLPQEVQDNAEAMQRLVEQFQEDPTKVTELFANVGVDLVALGILPEDDNDKNNDHANSLNHDNKEDGEGSTGIGGAIGSLFQLGAELLGLNGEGDDNNNNPQTDPDEGYDFTKDILIFNTDEVFTNISIEDGMQEVAAYFGVDNTDPDELDNFIDSFGACQFCDSGDMNPNLEFLGIECSDWLMFSLFSKQEECAILRAVAITHCDCQTPNLPVEPTMPRCNLCQDGSLHDVTLETPIPTMSNELSCGNITNLPAVEGDKTCEAVAGFGYICGCPGSVPQCHLCPGGGEVPARPEAVIQRAHVVQVNATNDTSFEEWVPELTCASFAEELTMNTRSTCPNTIKQLERETGLDIPSYCGCPANPPTPATVGCDPCPLGYKLKASSMTDTEEFLVVGLPTAVTCRDWELQYAPYVKDDSKCHAIQHQLQDHCCQPAEEGMPPNDGDTTVLVGRVSSTTSSSSASPSSSFRTIGDIMSSSWAAPVPMAIILVVAFLR